MNKAIEVWYQDPQDPALWHGHGGLIVNQQALGERSFYVDLIRVPARVPCESSTAPEMRNSAARGAR